MKHQKQFDELYDTYSVLVYSVCANFLHNKEEAEEITQDVFLAIYKNIKNFRKEANVKTWIYRITLNKCSDLQKTKSRLKRSGSTTHVSISNDEVNYIDTEDGLKNFYHPGIELEEQEAVNQIFDAISCLPENQKKAILLKSIEELSIKEISKVMCLTEKAIESLLSRARFNLKQLKNMTGAAKDFA